MKENLIIVVENEEQLQAVGAALASALLTAEKSIKERFIIFLYGTLGAGKTTLTRGFLRELGVNTKVKSPTYTIVESYQINELAIYHFDFYRLHDANELKQMGIQDYFGTPCICLIEWPERADTYLPKPDISCYLFFAAQGREIRLEAKNERAHAVINALKKQLNP